MLDILEKIKQTETQTLLHTEETQKKVEALLDEAEHQGKALLTSRRHEAHQQATKLLTDAEVGQREILVESDRQAKEEAERIYAIGEKNMARAIALIAERIVVRQ